MSTSQPSELHIIYIDIEGNRAEAMPLNDSVVYQGIVDGLHLSKLYVITLFDANARWIADQITATIKWELWFVPENGSPGTLICAPTYEEGGRRIIASYYERRAVLNGERIEQLFDTWAEADTARIKLLGVLYAHAEAQATKDGETELLERLISNVSAHNDAVFASGCASLARLLKIEAAQKAPAKRVDAA